MKNQTRQPGHQNHYLGYSSIDGPYFFLEEELEKSGISVNEGQEIMGWGFDMRVDESGEIKSSAYMVLQENDGTLIQKETGKTLEEFLRLCATYKSIGVVFFKNTKDGKETSILQEGISDLKRSNDEQ